MKTAYLLVNFGGPRTLAEVEPFLRSLLTDRDVVRTGMPQPVQNFIFGRIAKKRSEVVQKQYEEIGGSSPIYHDTEALAQKLEEKLQAPICTFHRYLPMTHASSLKKLEALDVDEIRVFPLFPQFTYATTGSIARFFLQNLPQSVLKKLRWIKSYPKHPAFINVVQLHIREFLQSRNLPEEQTVLFFSAHGVPKKFIEQGDVYEIECRASYQKVLEAFPAALGQLAYQSRFGKEEWLHPYTIDLCEQVERWHQGRQHVVFIPISFTSDHIETLYEIEKEYLPIIQDQGLQAYRLPSFHQRPEWVEAVAQILSDEVPHTTPMLIRWN